MIRRWLKQRLRKWLLGDEFDKLQGVVEDLCKSQLQTDNEILEIDREIERAIEEAIDKLGVGGDAIDTAVADLIQRVDQVENDLSELESSR